MLNNYYRLISFIKYYVFIILWFIPIIIFLKKKNFTVVKTFKIEKWHRGYAYFTGFYFGKKVFIKIDTKLRIISNDVMAYNILKKDIKNYLIEILDYEINNKINYIAFKFEDGEDLTSDILVSKISFTNDIVKILDILEKNDIYHRDLKLDNFLITKDGIKIIDFTFSISKSNKSFIDLDMTKSANCLILKGLGAGLNPKDFYWNDFYTLTNIFNELLIKVENKKDKDLLLKNIIYLNKKIKNKEYHIICNSKWYLIERNIKNFIKFLILK